MVSYSKQNNKMSNHVYQEKQVSYEIKDFNVLYPNWEQDYKEGKMKTELQKKQENQKKQEEEPKIVVNRVTIGGSVYLKSKDNTLYDAQTQEEIGVYDPINDTIKYLLEDDDDSEYSDEDYEEEPEIPKGNINICFVGGVSTGKSTILNAIFCEQLTQCKIKRTTMVPTVYIENSVSSNPFETDSESIYKKISEKNQDIITKTENGHKLSKEEYSELVFNVGKLDINILKDSFVNVYDIPGLNDARTKDVYYEYLENNFHKFNLVIFLVDIHSGLNTSDEIDMVNFITNNTRQQLEQNNRKIYTLVVVNKADDMQLDEEQDELVITGELGEMYEQVSKTLHCEFDKKNIAEHLVGIIPLCAIDSYLYRMVKKHGRSFKLSPEQILKIGVNENGKKFSTLKPATQERKVYEILDDANFIETMIKLSGFSRLEQLLHKFLNENNIGKQIRIDNLLYDLRKLPKLSDIAGTGNQEWFNMIIFENVVKKYCNLYDSIKEIDTNIYNEHIIRLVEEIETLLQDKVSIWRNNGNKDELIAFYDRFVEVIMVRYFQNYASVSEYPTYLTNKIMKMVEYTLEGHLSITKILHCFNVLKHVNMFTKPNVERIMNIIIEHRREFITISEILHDEMPKLLSILNEIVELDVIISELLRFLIINNYVSSNYTDEIIIYKMMIYKKYGEIPIATFLNLTNNGSIKTISKQFIRGLTSEILESPEYALDIFYLNYESAFNTTNFVNK
jgi:GTP-binding protein EngB required for normal cell division